MGVALTEILLKKETSLDALRGKTLAVDSSQWLYQFLSSIRQQDGALLTDAAGNVTSHLMGLLSRVSSLMQQDIKLVFVFDGEPPALKKKILQERKLAKQEAERKYQLALETHDTESMRKYASASTRLSKEMIGEAKQLIAAFGLPVINAPSEAEAQAAHMTQKGEAFAVATTDADALLFGAPRIVRNLNTAGKRKKTNTLSYETISPEIVSLQENLDTLQLTRQQLIALAMLVGTDYNPKGIKGIGPKNALKLVTQFKEDFEALFSHVSWNASFDYPWTDVYSLLSHAAITDTYTIAWNPLNPESIRKLLIDSHGFSTQRVDAALKPLLEQNEKKAQKGLFDFAS